MGSVFGHNLKISVFGESHGPGIGVVLDGFPAGLPLDLDFISSEMARRAPKKAAYSTKRSEADTPEILSGVMDGVTCGTPIAALIRNTNQRSADYDRTAALPRPSHADWTGFLRYQGHNDPHGGGHFSGRLTAPLVFAGALCKLALRTRGVTVGAHISSIGDIADSPFDPVALTADAAAAPGSRAFPTVDEHAGVRMLDLCAEVAKAGDSVGGIIECAAVGLPAGAGSPMFDAVESRLAAALFGVPAVKGVEFGAGFGFASMRGSCANDPFSVEGGVVRSKTNHNGGVLGGITTGMPLLFRVCIKPTASIALPQQSFNRDTLQPEELRIHGRHDPCIVPRAVPVIEAVCAAVLLDLLLEADGYQNLI